MGIISQFHFSSLCFFYIFDPNRKGNDGMFLMRKEIDELDERVYLDGQKAEVWRAGRVVESWPCSRPVGYLLLSVVLGRARASNAPSSRAMSFLLPWC